MIEDNKKIRPEMDILLKQGRFIEPYFERYVGKKRGSYKFKGGSRFLLSGNEKSKETEANKQDSCSRKNMDLKSQKWVF